MLEIDELSVAYGAVRALDGVGIEVERGGITAVLGANGAGKTTLLRTISGLQPPVAAGSPGTAGNSPAWRPTASRAAGSRTCPKAAGSSPN